MALVTSCTSRNTSPRTSHDSNGSLESLSTANNSSSDTSSSSRTHRITSLGIVRLEHVMDHLLQTSSSSTSTTTSSDSTCIKIMDEKTHTTSKKSDVASHRLSWNHAEQPDQVSKSTITCSSKASSETVISKA
ncbi:hypothetical protein O0I10_001262 [Lichtheimia ornata]|uniref:Uncharacterized protein n=1 Tax=Lichtheimia ornata TaxID=688661 RepID=A0AAD7Y3F5_9FUNG|nr:uncharacterized protein O0I10_001262 [Lichtheimia ornata]KAJ8663085.1 hypothetical protein O0I10_001262 [Lichtheimia ornata]